MPGHPDVLVIGAGVSGLTTGVCLAEAGLRVQVRASEEFARTTSAAAGAMWSPYPLGDDELRWSHETHTVLRDLVGDHGVRLCSGLEVSRLAGVPVPDWAPDLPEYRSCPAGELPAGFVIGYWYTTVMVDMPVYLGYLAGRLLAAGGELTVGRVGSLTLATREAPVVVNCTGMGARDLVGDTDVTPVRGQVVVVRNPGVSTFFGEYDDVPDPVYYLPHGGHVLLGGSYHHGRADLTPNRDEALAIRARCAEIEPRFATAEIIGHRVGIRPTRSRVRVDREWFGTRQVVHNYGHGGAGVTMSWGCARQVQHLVESG